MPPGAWIDEVPPGAWIDEVPPGAWIDEVPPGAWIDMILWFIGGACLIVVLVFGDPRIDYRLVGLGALLPDVPLRLTPLHSLTAGAAVLVAVMAATRRGDPRRRRLLAVPIGMLLHLVLDGSTDGLWWADGGRLPSLERPVAVLVLQEVAGLAALYWTWARVIALREAREGRGS